MGIAEIIALALQYGPEAWTEINALIQNLFASGQTVATPEQIAGLQETIAAIQTETDQVTGEGSGA